MKCGDNGGRTSSGRECQRDCATGLTRCNLHGASAPAAKIKAELMLAQARMPSCELLFSIVERYNDNVCVSCGRPQGDIDQTKVAIKAAQLILDRTGMGPRSVIELTPQSDGSLDFSQLQDSEKGELLAAIAMVKSVKDRLRARLLGVPYASTLLASQPDQEM